MDPDRVTETPYITLDGPGHVPIKAWVRGVELDRSAEIQLRKAATLPFVHGWIAAMPDVHMGIGATVGSVIPTRGAIVPAAVGVDIGCGMIAQRTSLRGAHLPDSLGKLRSAIEEAVPHGRTNGGRKHDRGAWGSVSAEVDDAFAPLAAGWKRIADKHRAVVRGAVREHLGTLGSGNHFIEVCLDESDAVWVMLHSGSRGVGNRVGRYFIELAKDDMRRHHRALADVDLAYLEEGSTHFDDYREAVSWAQEYARVNREVMMSAVLRAMRRSKLLGARLEITERAVDCHHNYVAREHHLGADVWVTRKGAVRAGEGELGIIPGSMGARSYIVRGKGNAESFLSCSHGAGRRMSRTQAKASFTLADHRAATARVECRKDKDVIDETPAAYKDIDAVMRAQADLVDVVHTLEQIVCVKG